MRNKTLRQAILMKNIHIDCITKGHVINMEMEFIDADMTTTNEMVATC